MPVGKLSGWPDRTGESGSRKKGKMRNPRKARRNSMVGRDTADTKPANIRSAWSNGIAQINTRHYRIVTVIPAPANPWPLRRPQRNHPAEPGPPPLPPWAFSLQARPFVGLQGRRPRSCRRDGVLWLVAREQRSVHSLGCLLVVARMPRRIRQ